ncbi:myosin heavy chain kinase B-like [Olea europaea subsp. europaea]|uniref:Myosin heavy chain kinase B-like n=1 Tax=Olea europaea subsp. europaea TaxID=158383 RepID=A0A8S0VLL5_OLEEU|nr:myosin heavy chain kinase B-like [Olea europaea subsp. europaea]
MGRIKATIGEIQAILAYWKMLFTTHGDYRIREWDVSLPENFRPKKTVTLPQKKSFFSYLKKNNEQHRDSISCIAYNHEELLYTGSWDDTVKFQPSPDNPGERILYSGSSNGLINFWEKERMSIIDDHHGPVKCLAAALETEEIMTGLLVYSASLDQTFKVWRVSLSHRERNWRNQKQMISTQKLWIAN